MYELKSDAMRYYEKKGFSFRFFLLKKIRRPFCVLPVIAERERKIFFLIAFSFLFDARHSLSFRQKRILRLVL